MEEEVFDVFWEGPFKWGEHEKMLADGHVLYAIFGAHPVYGHDSLLYIGKTENINNRMAVHADWIEDEYDDVSIRIASLDKISTWEGWDENPRYKKANPDYVAGVEALLIYSHSPAYNQMGKEKLRSAKGYRVFNSGRIGTLLPEVSYRYHNTDGEW